MNQPVNEEDKTLDSTSALDKVIRLDKKHTNFDYHDSLRGIVLKISYPQLQPEGPSSETLLKSLWRHVCNYYFKPMEEGQLKRLEYLKVVLGGHCDGNYRFEQTQEFWSTVEGLFSQDYLHKYLQGQNQRMELHNSLEMIHVAWSLATTRDIKVQKRKKISFEQIQRDLSTIWSGEHCQRQKLQLEARRLRDQLIRPAENNEIAQQIGRLERELKGVTGQVSQIFDKLEERVIKEGELQDILYCQNDERQIEVEQEGRIDRKLAKLQTFKVLTNYIEYTIRQLERRQIAESINKLLRLQKSKNEFKVLLTFEEAMGIRPLTVSEEQFLQINALREYSLLKFYNTASKSPYSFVCQNYLGFRDMYEYRNRPCSLKDKNILQEMKHTPLDPLSAPYYKEFGKMQICHHCKLLHPESALVRCEYKSSRSGNPVPPSPYYDSYIYQIIKSHPNHYPDEQSRISAIRFLNSSETRRNSYFHYIKKDEEYVCERKYCRYCLKNYEDGRDKSGGLCPYCRGICYCTRCARNDTMVRLKSLYVLLGGDINQLQQASLFQKYYSHPEDTITLRKKDKSKGSRRNNSAPSRLNEKMLNIRYQLEDLRIICDLVKRREKNKQKLQTCLRQTFRKKVEMITPELLSGVQEHKMEKVVPAAGSLTLSDKLTKKLKRMIS